MRKFLAGYLTFLCGIMATLGTVFVMGMVKGSMNSGDIESALIIAASWFIFLPLLVCGTIMCGQSFCELLRRPRGYQ